MASYYIGLVTQEGKWLERAQDEDDEHTGYIFMTAVGKALAEGTTPLDAILSTEELQLVQMPHDPNWGDEPFGIIDDPVALRSIFLRIYEHLGKTDEDMFHQWKDDLANAITICSLADLGGYKVEYHWGR